MIFNENAVCCLAYCQETRAKTGTIATPNAPLSLIFISSGRVAVTANSAPYLLTSGDLLLAHDSVELTPATDCHIVALGIAGVATQQILPHLAVPICSNTHVCPMVPQLVSELVTAYEDAHHISGISQLCYALLCALAHADDATPQLPRMVADAIIAIRQNYNGLYGIEELSAQLGVSKHHLVRVFSAEMGVPPGQYLTQVRLDAVKQLLAHRDYSLEVIATLTGFSGANYLCKVFKKAVGCTPATWRAQNVAQGTHHVADELESALFL